MDESSLLLESPEGLVTATFYGYLGTETLADGSLNPYTDYIYGGGLRISRATGFSSGTPTVVYYHTDALGSTRGVTDANKNVIFSDSYQPYGQDNTSTGTETYKFTGKPVSQTTGFYYYYYHRWYDPATGRFISHDPKPNTPSNPQTLNPYVYVQNCPSSHKDPSGEDSQVIPRGGAVVWFDDGSVIILGSQNDVLPTVAEKALHNIRPIQIDRSQGGPDTSTITYSDNTISVVNANDKILSIASKALQGVRPVSIQDTSGFSPFSVNNPPPKNNGVWLTNPSQLLLGLLACAATAAIIATLVLAPEAAPLEIGAEEVATEGAVISATSAAVWAHGASETIGTILLLGSACVTLTAGSFSAQ